MLPQRAGGLIGSHVPEGIGRLLYLAQASECRHVNAGAGWSRRTRGSGVSRGALQVGEMGRSDHQIRRSCTIRRLRKEKKQSSKHNIQQDQLLQNVHEVQVVQWVHPVHLIHLCQQVQLVQGVPTERKCVYEKAI